MKKNKKKKLPASLSKLIEWRQNKTEKKHPNG